MVFTEINVQTGKQTNMVNITEKILRIVRQSNISDGACIVFVPHTTCGLTINEAADPSVVQDILKELNKIVPMHADYSHMEGNSAAHIKTVLTGNSLHIPIKSGSPTLGTWQGIFLCEFDGPRNRSVYINLLASSE